MFHLLLPSEGQRARAAGVFGRDRGVQPDPPALLAARLSGAPLQVSNAPAQHAPLRKRWKSLNGKYLQTKDLI